MNILWKYLFTLQESCNKTKEPSRPYLGGTWRQPCLFILLLHKTSQLHVFWTFIWYLRHLLSHLNPERLSLVVYQRLKVFKSPSTLVVLFAKYFPIILPFVGLSKSFKVKTNKLLKKFFSTTRKRINILFNVLKGFCRCLQKNEDKVLDI